MEIDTTTRVIAIVLLILCSSYFSLAEISLAASHRVTLQQMFNSGDKRAKMVLDLQEKPGPFFSVIQIGLNAIAILGGIVGETIFSPLFEKLLGLFLSPEASQSWGFVCSFLLVTMLFVLFADLIPKRVALAHPEGIALKVIRSMNFLIFTLKPIVWFLTSISNCILRIFGVPILNKKNISSEDLLATVDAVTRAGILDSHEQAVIENVITMEDRPITSAMTPRDSCVFFTLDDSPEKIRAKIDDSPHSKFLICEKNIDHVIGYIDSKTLLKTVVAGKPLSLTDKGLIEPILAVPDTLSLSEVLEIFRKQGNDFAIVINEYALTIGVVTLKDIMSSVMGDMVPVMEEDSFIVKRDEDTWLMDGATPVLDVSKELDIDEWPDEGMYETLAGFMINQLRKVPKVTDKLKFSGYSFEVIDVERNRIDQILVTKLVAEGKKTKDNQGNSVNTDKQLQPEQKELQQEGSDKPKAGEPQPSNPSKN